MLSPWVLPGVMHLKDVLLKNKDALFYMPGFIFNTNKISI